MTLLLTPTSNLGINGGSQHPDKRKAGGHGPTLADQVEHLLPTPVVNDMGDGKTVERWDEWTDEMREKHGNGNGHGKSLAIEAQRMTLLPTPRASDGPHGGPNQTGDSLQPTLNKLLPTPTSADSRGTRNATPGRQPGSQHHSGTTLNDVAYADKWGEYGPAVARWEHVFGRPSPEPVDEKSRLAPEFARWMMGWPEDHTAVPGLSRAHRLRAIGNGVVPQQAAHAYRHLLSRAWDSLEYLEYGDLPGVGPAMEEALLDAGYWHPVCLLTAPEGDLLNIKGLGPKGLARIREFLDG